MPAEGRFVLQDGSVTSLTIISKPDCHLCDVAREIVETVVAELPARWWEKIPVILIDGRLHAHWRVSPERLRAALTEKDDKENR
jgi:hypothetical protein